MVPAILVFRPSVAKRESVLMPDAPLVSLAQLSLLPAPSEVITPSPVTTTTGRPILSLPAAIASLLNQSVQRERDLRHANDPRRVRPLASTLRSSAAPDRLSHQAGTDYHRRVRSGRARYSWQIAAPTHGPDMNPWRERQDRDALRGKHVLPPSPGSRQAHRTQWPYRLAPI